MAGGWCRGFSVEYIYSPCIEYIPLVGPVAGRSCSSVSAPCLVGVLEVVKDGAEVFPWDILSLYRVL